jgi:hypothetical protein
LGLKNKFGLGGEGLNEAAVSFFSAFPGDWAPHRIVVIAAIFLGIAGIMVLCDELTA